MSRSPFQTDGRCHCHSDGNPDVSWLISSTWTSSWTIYWTWMNSPSLISDDSPVVRALLLKALKQILRPIPILVAMKMVVTIATKRMMEMIAMKIEMKIEIKSKQRLAC